MSASWAVRRASDRVVDHSARAHRPAVRQTCVGPLLIAAAFGLGLAAPAQAAGKHVTYPEVKVTLPPAYQTEPAFDAMRRDLAAAVSRRDKEALFRLVGPMFVWTYQYMISTDFDMGQTPLENLEIVFGFRAPGSHQDAEVTGGPYWAQLDVLAPETSFFKMPDIQNLMCGPVMAGIADETVFEQANKLVETPEEPVSWHFTLSERTVTASPAANAAPVAKVGAVAMPVLSVAPAQTGTNPPKPTHVEVLLPSGQSGFVPLAAVRPMVTNRLSYAKTSAGDRKIVYFDQNEN